MLKTFIFAITLAVASAPAFGQPTRPSPGVSTSLPASDRAALQMREDTYTAGILHKDIRALDSVWAETFVDTGENGSFATKTAELRKIAASTTVIRSLNVDQVRVDFYAPVTAVVTERFQVVYANDGKTGTARGRATDVWVKQKGVWMCVAAHSSAIRQ